MRINFINGSDMMDELLKRSRKIDDAFLQCATILKCHPSEVIKRAQKMSKQLKECEDIIKGVVDNGKEQ